MVCAIGVEEIKAIGWPALEARPSISSVRD